MIKLVVQYMLQLDDTRMLVIIQMIVFLNYVLEIWKKENDMFKTSNFQPGTHSEIEDSVGLS